MTNLTSDDLPTLRKLVTFWAEKAALPCTTTERGPLGLVRSIARQTISTYLSGAFRRAVLAIERAGHLAQDDRLDNDGKASKL